MLDNIIKFATSLFSGTKNSNQKPSKTSTKGLEFIERWEGCVLKPYKDVAGLRTIGIGHLIQSGENFPDGVAITRDRALQLLASDLKKCEDAIARDIVVPLTQDQFDALASFGFNCGVGVYRSSTACKVLNEGRYEEFCVRLLDWSKATINGTRQVVPGLLSRRKAEVELFSGKIVDGFVPWTKGTLSDVQSRLKKMGLYGGKVDGAWGPMTSAAVQTFASVNGVKLDKPSDGVTKEFLNKLIASTG